MTFPVKALLDTPNHHFFAFEGDQATFVEMDRAAYQRSIFLDRRISPLDGRGLHVPIRTLTDHLHAAKPAMPRICWIFHVAHCGSTLLARALDHAEADLVLREPVPLRQLGVIGAGGGRSDEWNVRLRLALTMAGRRFVPSAPVIVKGNVPINFILPDILKLDPGAPAILLHYPLEPYLLAILRTAEHRMWVGRIGQLLGPAISAFVGDITGLDTIQLAAALWLAQMRLYAEALERFPQTRSLDADSFFASPRSVIEAAFAHFNVSIEPSIVAADVASDLFATHSKNPALRFDDRAWQAERSERAIALKPELARARRWVEGRLGVAPLPSRLPRSLSGEEGPLLL